MAKFHVRFLGSAGVVPINEVVSLMESQLHGWVCRTLVRYHPVYYSAAVWLDVDGEPKDFVGVWEAKVEVKQTHDMNAKVMERGV